MREDVSYDDNRLITPERDVALTQHSSRCRDRSVLRRIAVGGGAPRQLPHPGEQSGIGTRDDEEATVSGAMIRDAEIILRHIRQLLWRGEHRQRADAVCGAMFRDGTRPAVGYTRSEVRRVQLHQRLVEVAGPRL